MVKPVATVNVVPDLPEPLQRLQELAYNLRWAWDHETMMLFRRLNADLWDTSHNPIWTLGRLSQDQLDAAAVDPGFLAQLHNVCQDYDEYMNSQNTWYRRNYGDVEKPTIAYFSMEFGLTECLQNYSGGLGVLSGDHLKSASDLGLPLIGVGLLYQEGYFRQYLNADGYQQEEYPLNDYTNLPVTLQVDSSGNPLKISVPMPGRQLYARIWKAQVGRVALYLLDTNIADNPLPEDRDLADRLYGGDRRTRIRQEILMGIGGIRALDALGLRPDICHMNEGHSAFLALERISQLMKEHNLFFSQAREISSASNIFTTHTPVPAGLERFGFDLIDEHFTDYYKTLGLTRDQFLDLGRETMGDYDLFSMAVLALRLSAGYNGVAQLHGVVSQDMWQWLYPDLPRREIPIKAITNGIHVQSWVSQEMSTLLNRYLSPDWRTDEELTENWQDIDKIPDAELWRTHERQRERLVTFAREQLRRQLQRRGAPPSELMAADEVLNAHALTIGFARRFATYKRATLLLRDRDRLRHILTNPERPIQFIFAGKAHPHDDGGKQLIQQIVLLAREEGFRHSIVFLENYDMRVARYLVQGVDIWLNNPRRPKEASGTSGMKAIYNGVLNCSILDGWWDEAYTPEVGWAIGNGEEYVESDAAHQDYIESEALYNILEQDIAPLFYTRGRDDLPRGWITKMKNSMRTLSPFFNTRRMVQEYTQQFYMPNFQRVHEIYASNLEEGITYAAWRESLKKVWNQVVVKNVHVSDTHVKVNKSVEVTADVQLGALKPEDVRVQLYYGALDSRGYIGDEGEAVDMQPAGQGENGAYVFSTEIAYHTGGDRGLSVRVVPYHKLMHTSFQPGLITWA